MPKKLISVITPCFNEELNVQDCIDAVKALFSEKLSNYDYEHIFCDNASSDSTVDILTQNAKQDSRIKITVNSRNFGPFRSLFNGVCKARGDAVVVMLPADLQDPPELIPEFVKLWEQGYEVVYGVRANRQESKLMHLIRKIYYRVLSRCADINIPLDAGEFQLIDKVVVEALKQHDDYYPYIRGMIANCGFRSVGVNYVWKIRRKGFSKNSFYHLIDQGLNGLISFTNFPMRLCMFSGLIIAILSLLFAAFALVYNIIYYGTVTVRGIPTLIVALFFFGGVQLLFLGVIGEYVAAIHSQVRKRPLVVTRKEVNFTESNETLSNGCSGSESSRKSAAIEVL
ncbi:MAG: glycosyltransferase family 2 protein [Gammaproteobacteria bacterium]|nr:glycosyltransferase family 2 protein [Gammaproteobacteria bacterium]